MAAAYTADNLCIKQGNVGLKSRVASNQERLMMAHIWYLLLISTNLQSGKIKTIILSSMFNTDKITNGGKVEKV